MNDLTPTGPFSVAFRFFGVLPRESWGYEFDRLHMMLRTSEKGKFNPIFTPKKSFQVSLIGEEIKL